MVSIVIVIYERMLLPADRDIYTEVRTYGEIASSTTVRTSVLRSRESGSCAPNDKLSDASSTIHGPVLCTIENR